LTAAVDIVDASYCMVLDNNVLECASGVSFRAGNANTGSGWFTCRGNTVTAVGSVPAGTAGIDLRYARGGRVADNSVTGFAGNSVACFGCGDLTIAGNTIHGGENGVFVGGDTSQSITVAGNTLTGPRWGIQVSTTTPGAFVVGVIVSANTVFAPTEGGVLVSRTGNGQVSGVSVIDNELHIAYARGRYGVKMVNTDCCRVDRNRDYRPIEQAVYLDGVDIVQVTDNTLQDAGHTAANAYDAVYVTNAHRVIARDNLVYGSADYAVRIRITGGTGMTVSGTRWRALDRGGLYSQATNNNVYFDNRGFLPTVRLMPLGDSITEGTAVPGGYRTELWKTLVAGGYQVDFVGSQNNGPADLDDHDHEGHPGWRIDQVHSQVQGWFADTRPRTALLHIGTNDVLQAFDLATAPTRLAALIDRMLAAVPYLHLFVATIGPLTDRTREANATAFNAGVRGVVAARESTGRVHLVDMHTRLSTIDLADGIHPNATGYARMAAAWYAALLSVPQSLTLPPATAG
jgi:lysophospholipase L1-like esterase/nitrous oxidase accessory protein NosD